MQTPCKALQGQLKGYYIMHTPISLPGADVMRLWVNAGFKEYSGVLDFPFYASKEAPHTFEGLQLWAANNELGVDPLPVYSGGSEGSIYGTAQGNYEFRAWHDLIHLTENLSFAIASELQVAEWHCNVLKYIKAPYAVIAAIDADVRGQILYYQGTNLYVGNQIRFVEDCLKYGVATVMHFVATGARY